jgi:hypothetical protein
VTAAARRAAAALALGLALPALAYVLPVPGILRRMGERRAALNLDTLEVRGTLAARGAAGDRLAAAGGVRPATEVSVPARFLAKVPGRCRLEVVREGVAETERAFVAIRDGKLSGPLADVPAAAAAVHAACTLLAGPTAGDATPVYSAALGRRGVALSEATLGRFDGRLAYVIGGLERNTTKPLLFVDKDGFQPLRLVASEGPELVDVRFLGWGSPTGGDWFPRALEAWVKDALALRFTTERASANPKLAETLFPAGR